MEGSDHSHDEGTGAAAHGTDPARSPFTPPEGWRALDLEDAVAAGGWHVWYVPETASTNTDLLELADAPDHTVLSAGHQTAGRGRLDRRWDAPPDANLLVSILFRDVPDPPSDLTHRVGVAVVEAARAAAGVDARLKWPNDVMVDGRKLAGILAQRASAAAVVVGVGVNVRWAPDGAARLGPDIAPTTVLTQLLRALNDVPHDLHERYRELLSTLGSKVRVELPNGELVGRAVDVERDGRLVVVDECAISHRVDVGDVVHLRSTT